MKKHFMVLIALVLFLSLLVVRHNYNKNRIINYDSYVMHRRFQDEVSYNNEIDGVDASEIMEEVLTGFYTWDRLLLTDDFKNKFKNRKKIVSEIDDIYRLFAENNELNGKKIIKVYLDKNYNKLTDLFFNSATVICCFEYSMDGDKLDDIRLVKKQYVDSTTADIIKEFVINK